MLCDIIIIFINWILQMNIGLKPQAMAMVLMSSCLEEKLVLIRKMMLSISKLELWLCQLWMNFDNHGHHLSR